MDSRFANWPARYREIIEAAAVEFCRLHPDLDFAQSETCVPETDWVVVTEHPAWCWRKTYGETGYYRIELLLTDDINGIYLRNELEDGPGREERSLTPTGTV